MPKGYKRGAIRIEGFWRMPKEPHNLNLKTVHQANLGKALGIHPSHMARIIGGYHLMISFLLVYRMAKLLEVSLDDLAEALIMERYRNLKRTGKIDGPTQPEE